MSDRERSIPAVRWSISDGHPSSTKMVELGMHPGITATTSPTDYFALKQFQMFRFNGEEWLPFGPIVGR